MINQWTHVTICLELEEGYTRYFAQSTICNFACGRPCVDGADGYRRHILAAFVGDEGIHLKFGPSSREAEGSR